MFRIELNSSFVNFPQQPDADIITQPGIIPRGTSNAHVSLYNATEGYNPVCRLTVTTANETLEFAFRGNYNDGLWHVKGFTNYYFSINPKPIGDQKVSFDFEFEGNEFNAAGKEIEPVEKVVWSQEVRQIIAAARKEDKPITVTNVFQNDQPWIHEYLGKFYQVLSLHDAGKVYSMCMFLPPAEAQTGNVEPYQIEVRSVTGIAIKLRPYGVDAVSFFTFISIVNET